MRWHPPYRIDIIARCIARYYHRCGKIPNRYTKEDPGMGFPTTWRSISHNLIDGGRSLPGGDSIYQVAIRFRILETPDTLTLDMIETAIRAFYRCHSRPPTTTDKDAKRWGLPCSWNSVGNHLAEGHGQLQPGQSLSSVAARIQMYHPNVKPDLELGHVKAVVLGYHKVNGKAPREDGGDASAYFGFPETWKCVHVSLLHGTRGLPPQEKGLFGLCVELDLRAPTEAHRGKDPLTRTQLQRAILYFAAEHDRGPNAQDGDSFLYTGSHYRWGSIEGGLHDDRWFPSNGQTLAAMARELGIHGARKVSPWCSPLLATEVKIGMLEFRAKNGTWPNRKSGDASEHIKREVSWEATHKRLVAGRVTGVPEGTTLTKFRDQLIAETAANKPDLTVQQIKYAIARFYEVEGRAPTQRSGDATAYFGFPESWNAVNLCGQKNSRGVPLGLTLRVLACEMAIP